MILQHQATIYLISQAMLTNGLGLGLPLVTGGKEEGVVVLLAQTVQLLMLTSTIQKNAITTLESAVSF